MSYKAFFEAHFKGIKWGKGGEGMTICPFHNDRKPSLSLNHENGLWYCHAGCGGGTVQELAKRIGVDPPYIKPGTPLVVYDYKDEKGRLLYQVVRYPDKRFRQRRPDGKGDWKRNIKGVRRVLYRLPELINSSGDVFIVEGEKDVETLMAQGLTATTNPGGAGKWKEEYNEYLKGRTVYILPDNDEAGWKHASRIRTSLQGKASTVKVIELPGLPEGADVTDWLNMGHTKDELLSISEMAPDEPFIQRLLDKMGQRKDLRFAQDFHDGKLWYGVLVEGKRLIISSDRKICSEGILPPDISLKDGGLESSCITKEAIESVLSESKEDTGQLLHDLVNIFLRYMKFEHRDDAVVLASWIMGTYCYQVFQVFPYLIVTSITKRCGKTRLLQLLRHLGFNSSPVMTNPSEAVLFRTPSSSGGLVLLDEMENLSRTDSERYSLLLSILNVGFQKGGAVPRMEKGTDGVLRQKDFPVYCPRAIATTTRQAETLEDRSIIISLPRRLPEERIERLSEKRIEKEAAPLRDRLVVWALSHAHTISREYESLDNPPELEGLDDRAHDLFEPLYVISSLAGRDGKEVYFHAFIERVQVLKIRRRRVEEEGRVQELIRALLEICKDPEIKIQPEYLREQINKIIGWEIFKTTKALAPWMGKLGFISRHTWIDGKSSRAYHLDRDTLEVLQRRYVGGVIENNS